MDSAEQSSLCLDQEMRPDVDACVPTTLHERIRPHALQVQVTGGCVSAGLLVPEVPRGLFQNTTALKPEEKLDLKTP